MALQFTKNDENERRIRSDFQKKYLTMHIPIAKEGWPFLIPVIILCIISIFLGRNIMAYAIGFIALCIALFFRDPDRRIINDESAILAPADGRILEIKRIEGQDNGVKSAVSQVSIFMSIFNCHINRIPISGSVVKIKYNKGKFISAFNEKASLLNEQNLVNVSRDNIELGIRQIAGLIARRIVCRIKPGDSVAQGERFGLIRFGSRVDLLLSENVEIITKPGQKVKGGLSVIGRIRD